MNIKNYTFITGKKIQRPWGFEFRYTVQNQDERKIDSIINLVDGNETDGEIEVLITNQLLKIDVIPEPVPDPIEEAKNEKEEEIRQILIEKGLLTEEDEIGDLKNKDEILAAEEVR